MQAKSTASSSAARLELFSINYDLSSEIAREVRELRFGLKSRYDNKWYKNDTSVFNIKIEIGMLSNVNFGCHAYDGLRF